MEVSAETDALRSTLAAPEAGVRLAPVGRSSARREQPNDLLDRHAAVVATPLARDDQIRALAAEFVDRSDWTDHGAYAVDQAKQSSADVAKAKKEHRRLITLQ